MAGRRPFKADGVGSTPTEVTMFPARQRCRAGAPGEDCSRPCYPALKAGAGYTVVGPTPTLSATVQRPLHTLEGEVAGGHCRPLSGQAGSPAGVRDLGLPRMESEAAGG